MGGVQASRLQFNCLGAGAEPPVLAFHSYWDLPHMFCHQMRALAAAGYRVVAPYTRGSAPCDLSHDFEEA